MSRTHRIPHDEFLAAYRHPKWQKKRLEILNRDDFTCRSCTDSSSELHVHHGFYEDGLAPWDYPNSTLFTYCEPCHQYAHQLVTSLRAWVGRLDTSDLMRTLGYVASLSWQKGNPEGFAEKTWNTFTVEGALQGIRRPPVTTTCTVADLLAGGGLHYETFQAARNRRTRRGGK